jgi:glycosyltransferase involved in cell wall biosynthesis
MTAPRLSVVMSVFNGGADLAATLDSILAQTMRDFELIVIDDGSTDGTLPILADYARRDARIRLLTQPNLGLTHALIRGCAEARAAVIARHDCGDRSRPERLARGVEVLERNPSLVLAACEVEYVGPEGELLYVTEHHKRDVRHSLLHDDVDTIIALPHHGTAMFRAQTYRSAGGYRQQFRVAQDIDLWIRLALLGEIFIDQEPLYVAHTNPRAISAGHRDAQFALARIAIALRDGGDGDVLLARAARIAPRRRPSRADEARGLYFIGSCLRRRGDARWRGYMRRALMRNPLHWRALLTLLAARTT